MFVYIFYLFIYLYSAGEDGGVGSWEGTNGVVLKEDLSRSFEIRPLKKPTLKSTQNSKTNKQTNKHISLQTAQKWREMKSHSRSWFVIVGFFIRTGHPDFEMTR